MRGANWGRSVQSREVREVSRKMGVTNSLNRELAIDGVNVNLEQSKGTCRSYFSLVTTYLQAPTGSLLRIVSSDRRWLSPTVSGGTEGQSPERYLMWCARLSPGKGTPPVL